MSYFRWKNRELEIDLRVQPRASRDEIVGAMGERLKVRITAPPVDGKANAHLVKFLARQFGVTRAGVRLVRGEAGRDKTIAIENPRRVPGETGITAPEE